MNLKNCLAAIACASLATASAFAAETTNSWESSIGAGLTVTKGNSDTLMANANFLSLKKWDRNELSFGGDATYGEAEFEQDNGETDDEVTAQNFRAFMQYNRLFTERLFGYLRVDGLHDDIADIDYRFSFSPGLGYYFIKNDRTFLRAEVGPGYVIEKQGGETDDYMTLRIAERFEHKLSGTAKLWQSLEFLPQVDDWENFIVNAEIGIEAMISKSLSLRTYLQDTYDNEPAPGRDENDLKLFSGISYKF